MGRDRVGEWSGVGETPVGGSLNSQTHVKALERGSVNKGHEPTKKQRGKNVHARFGETHVVGQGKKNFPIPRKKK